MSICVTGGCGFLGSHLVYRLLDDRFDVTVVDDLSSNPVSIDQLKTEFGSMWTRADWIFRPIEYYRPIGKHSAIYHLASPVGPAGILQYSGYIAERIMSATRAAITLAQENHCRLVLVSTSEIYGGGVQGLCREDMACQTHMDQPSARLEYAVGKMAAELMALNTEGLDVVIVRPFNIAGARQSRAGGFVLPTFVDQALAGEPLTVFGSGHQVRAFTHIADMVDGLILAMREGCAGQAYNLGNPANKTTVQALAEEVLRQVDGPSKITYTDGKLIYGEKYAESSDKYPDASRAMTELGWQPTRSIQEIVADVIAYERNRTWTNQKETSGKS